MSNEFNKRLSAKEGNNVSLEFGQNPDKINISEVTMQFRIHRKDVFHKYLKSIWCDLSQRTTDMKRGISKLTFFSYFPLPGIIFDRLFSLFNTKNQETLDLSDFMTGMKTLFSKSYDQLSKFIFDFYDFDNDGKVTRDDIRLVFSYISLSNFSLLGKYKGYIARVNSQEEMFLMLDKVFVDSIKYINYQRFLEIVDNICCDIFLLLLLFIYERRPFTQENINSYAEFRKSKNFNSIDKKSSTEELPKLIAGLSKVKSFSPCKFLRGSTYTRRKNTFGEETSNLFKKFFDSPVASRKKKSSFKDKNFKNGSLKDLNFLENLDMNLSDKIVIEDEPTKVELEENKRKIPQRRNKNCNLKGIQQKKKKIDVSIIGAYEDLQLDGLVNRSPPKSCKETKRMPSPEFSSRIRKSAEIRKTGSLTSNHEFTLVQPIVETVESIDESESQNSSNDSESSTHQETTIINMTNKENIFCTPFKNVEEKEEEKEDGKEDGKEDEDEDDEFAGLRAQGVPNSRKRTDEYEEKSSTSSIVSTAPKKYESYLYKERNNELVKYYFKLVGKDFYFAMSSTSDVAGMHNLSGVFFSEEPPRKIKDVTYFCFVLHFNKKVRKYLTFDESIYKDWCLYLKNVTFYQDLKLNYSVSQEIGSGRFGVIKLGMNKSTGRTVAIKIMEKDKMNEKDFELVRTEIEILKISQHPNIIRLYEVYEDYQSFYIVMEYCNGGDLYSYLEPRDFILPEKRACEVIHKICTAVYYFHSYGIAHRDLKPENILMTDKTDEADIRILDFGLSKILAPNETCNDPYGTICYVAPEVLLEEPYNQKVDIWSIGVITYLILCGQLPFDDENDEEEIARQTVSEQPDMSWGIWNNISEEAKDFIKEALNKDQKKRVDVRTLLEHRWFLKFFGELIDKRKKSFNELCSFKMYSSIENV